MWEYTKGKFYAKVWNWGWNPVRGACFSKICSCVGYIKGKFYAVPQETRNVQIGAKNHSRTRRRQSEKTEANEIANKLPPNLQRAMEVSSEKGASTWLNTLPIADHGFTLHKGAFRDALCLRYGWHPEQLPSRCVCDQRFTIEHALSCSRGGFPSIRHNEIRDITAEFLTEICHGVGTEPCLQPVTGERLAQRSANREDGARLDIVAEDFWGRDRQLHFLMYGFLTHSHRAITTPLSPNATAETC